MRRLFISELSEAVTRSRPELEGLEGRSGTYRRCISCSCELSPSRIGQCVVCRGRRKWSVVATDESSIGEHVKACMEHKSWVASLPSTCVVKKVASNM